MSANPVDSWDLLVAAATESTFGTTPAPANTAALAALAIETIDCSLGEAEVGVVRAKQDRSNGRGMQSGWVEGRVQPIGWSLDTSLKSRAAVDTASPLLPLLKAAGLLHTINGGSNVTITTPTTPIESSVFAGVSLTKYLGQGLACKHAETLRGCVVKSLRLEGGASEVLAKFTGSGIGKTTATGQAGVQGRIDSITLATGVVTSLTITADESKRLGLGYYLCEAEVIQVTACTPGGTTATIVRGALGTTGAAHTAQPLVPYRPTPTFTGSPISEAAATVTLGGLAVRARSWSLELNTGIDLLDGETGSRYSQGVKATRYSASVKLQLVLSGDMVSRIGDVQGRTNLALAISQGTGTGGIVTVNAPYCEVMPFTTPSTANDIAVVDLELRLRDNTASDMLSIVLT